MINWRVRDAEAKDVPDILRLVKDLAVFAKNPESVVKLTEQEMLRDGFGEKPWFESLIAEELHYPEGNSNVLPKKRTVGYALFSFIYSTWEGRCLFLQDMYIEPTLRGKGVAKELFRRVVQIAVEKGCTRVEGHVLNWNKAAKNFYTKIGLESLDKWKVFRLTGKPLLEFAGKKSKIVLQSHL